MTAWRPGEDELIAMKFPGVPVQERLPPIVWVRFAGRVTVLLAVNTRLFQEFAPDIVWLPDEKVTVLEPGANVPEFSQLPETERPIEPERVTEEPAAMTKSPTAADEEERVTGEVVEFW